MQESSYKVHPLLAAVRPGSACKQAVRVRECVVKQGNQIVFEHSLHLGALLVLPVCGFQHEPYLILWDVLGIASQWSRP